MINYSNCESSERFIGMMCIATVSEVCGVYENGTSITYNNRCYACKNSYVEKIYDGQC